MIRRLLMGLGVVALVVFVLIGVGVGAAVYKGNALNASAQAYTDNVVPLIAAHWSEQSVLERATPELKRLASAEQWAAVEDSVSLLGPFQHYDGSKGTSNMSYFLATGTKISASFLATASFSHGKALINIALLKIGGRWMINGLHVQAIPSGPKDGKA
jgi:hypothetical protein